MENDLIKSLNKIKSTINENDQIVWACQASTHCYNEASKKLKDESARLVKEIARIDGEIKEYAPQVDILENCVKVQEETLRISQESLLTHRLYKKCVEENLNKHKKEAESLVEEYSKHFQLCKEKLELTNPIYRILQDKRIELKKCRIECLILQQRIAQGQKINNQRTEIRKKLFYADIVALAEAWLERKKYLAVMKEFEEVKQKEIQCMIRLMETKEKIKMKQRSGYSRKESKVPKIEFTKNNMGNDTNTLTGKKQDKDNDLIRFEKRLANPFHELKDLLEDNVFTPPDPLKTDTKTMSMHNNYFPKTEFNPIHSKVRILENKTLKLPQEQTRATETAISREERSRAIDAKLKKVVLNFNRSLSQQQQSQQTSLKKDVSKLQNERSVCSQEEKASKMEVVEIPTSQKETGATQELEKLNILSQDVNAETALNMVSQESTKNPETVLKKFKYSPETSTPFADKLVPVQSEKNGVNLFGLKSTPMKISQEGLRSPRVDASNSKEVSQKPPNNGFVKAGEVSFVKNGQFSLKSGTNAFGGSFSNKEQKMDTNNFLTKTVPNNMFKTDTTPMGLQQISKNNADLQTVFKKPDQGITFASQDQIHMDTSMSNDDNNFLNMGGQYNFGNLSQFSQNPNETVDYDVAWSPPEADFAKSPLTDNNTMFSFGQSCTGFGFKF